MEGLSGSKNVVCMERDARNLGDPVISCIYLTGKLTQSKKRIAEVLQGVGLTHSTLRRESRPRGEGVNGYTQFSKETLAGHVGLEQLMQTSLRKTARKLYTIISI